MGFKMRPVCFIKFLLYATHPNAIYALLVYYNRNNISNFDYDYCFFTNFSPDLTKMFKDFYFHIMKAIIE